MAFSTNCQLVAHRCDSYEDFVDGRCFDCGTAGEKCAILGERAIEYKPFTKVEASGKKFYLKTAKKSPFCRKPGLKLVIETQRVFSTFTFHARAGLFLVLVKEFVCVCLKKIAVQI